MRAESERLLKAFWQRLRQSRRPVLMLDYDGTLAPFCVERDRAVPYPGVREQLAVLMAATATRVVIVTGRPAAELSSLLKLDPRPEIWGCHGWERLLPDGRHSVKELPMVACQALEQASAWIAEQGLDDHSERKPVSVTLHWRGLVDREAERLRAGATAAWKHLAREGGLELHPFDGGLELRHPGRDKGTVVNEVLAATPEGDAVAYLGDDLTDEDAFCALGERGMGVLVRAQWRPSAARIWLRPPVDLLQFLHAWQHHAARGKDG